MRGGRLYPRLRRSRRRSVERLLRDTGSDISKQARGGRPERMTSRGKLSPFRVSWGTITRPHGGCGLVRAKFTRNLLKKLKDKKHF